MTTTWDTLLAQATSRFANAAAADGMVDVAVRLVETPVGTLLLAVADGALVRVGFDVEGHESVVAQLAAAVSGRVLEAPHPVLDEASEQLAAYFAGDRTDFDLPVDLRLARGPFRREVLGLLPTIPAGQTRTYAELATLAGRPTAVRAAGSSCATNPVPIFVPCHRVLRTGGQLGGYLGGVDRKRWLLDHEQAAS